MKFAILAALVLALVCAPLFAQKPSVDDQWVAFNKELKRAYDQKDWPGAMSVIDRMLKLVADRPVVSSAGADMLVEWKPFILRNAFYFKFGNDQRSFEHRTTAQLALAPKGAPNPKKFAGGSEEVFAGAIYTSNPDSFYAPPRR
jgi:hypothetical protein